MDKHSTGGVGDKVSLILAPMVAACGVPVLMISGRGLGHTGGTLDKLESIPGFRTRPRSGGIPIGPRRNGSRTRRADRKDRSRGSEDVRVARRHRHGRVPPPHRGSIMSKQARGGTDALVLDVRTGEGAFMEDPEKAAELARTLVAIGERYGKRTVAFLTAMDQPLGHRRSETGWRWRNPSPASGGKAVPI
ncbi:MAG: hypothetical protein MZV64_29580 [Ignavibacteriales bacterium]|nr:hypothetical protein [Ignavibacteriales bacterium]